MPDNSQPDNIQVLLVDDEITILEAFVDILEDEGYTMFSAESGQKALEILNANSIDIVVSDIKMPGMDGLELLSKIRELDDEIPVIMATAYASIENTVEAMRLGASNYLIKPIQVELLRAVLAEGATKRRMLRQHREMTQSVKKSNEANEYTESIHEYNEEAQIKVILEAAAWKSEHQADKQQMGRRRCHLGRGDWNGSTIVH